MKKLFYLIPGVAILLICFFLYQKDISQYPSAIHTWTQSDRLALSLCFLENGFDLFHPCTFHYNMQLHSNITATDCPLNEYIIALLMKITGSTSPFIFRVYTLLYSLTGLFFLYKMTVQLSKSVFTGILIVVFTFFSPVYFYYQIGFLPTIPSIASVFIGMYFCFQYYEYKDQKKLWIGIVFLTLAALYRLPFLIFLIAAGATQVLEYFKKRKIFWKEIILFALGFFLVVGYFNYNIFLRNKYGSVFLGQISPAANLNEFFTILKISFTYWVFQYFTTAHYILLLFFAIAFIISKRFLPPTFLSKKLACFLLLSFTGVLFYSCLMIKQFQHHDYYFLDTFFVPIILGTMFLLSRSDIAKLKFSFFYSLTISIVLILCIPLCMEVYKTRNSIEPSHPANLERESYIGGDKFLDSIGISPSAKLLVLGANTTSMPFILLKRKGYVQMDGRKDSIMKALKLDFDYIVMQNNLIYNEVLLKYPDIIKRLTKIADNGKLSVYKLTENGPTLSVIDFIGFSDRLLKNKISINYDSSSYNACIKQIGEISDSISRSEPRSGLLTSEYGTLVELHSKNTDSTKALNCYFEGYYSTNDHPENFSIIISVDDLSGNISYNAISFNQHLIEKNKWSKVSFTFLLPKLDHGKKASVYLYNPAKKKIFSDDILLLVR